MAKFTNICPPSQVPCLATLTISTHKVNRIQNDPCSELIPLLPLGKLPRQNPLLLCVGTLLLCTSLEKYKTTLQVLVHSWEIAVINNYTILGICHKSGMALCPSFTNKADGGRGKGIFILPFLHSGP